MNVDARIQIESLTTKLAVQQNEYNRAAERAAGGDTKAVKEMNELGRALFATKEGIAHQKAIELAAERMTKRAIEADAAQDWDDARRDLNSLAGELLAVGEQIERETHNISRGVELYAELLDKCRVMLREAGCEDDAVDDLNAKRLRDTIYARMVGSKMVPNTTSLSYEQMRQSISAVANDCVATLRRLIDGAKSRRRN